MRTFTKPTTVRGGVTPPRAVDFNNHARAIEELQRAAQGQRPKTGRRAGSVSLPFQISVTSDTLKAAPGTIDGDSIAETTKASPANGTWYLEAKVTINDSTGVVTATAAQWSASASTDTATLFYSTIGTVVVTSGVPDANTITQANYGPLLVILHGTSSAKWGAMIF